MRSPKTHAVRETGGSPSEAGLGWSTGYQWRVEVMRKSAGYDCRGCKGMVRHTADAQRGTFFVTGR